MKKVIYLIVSLILFFYLGINKSIFTNANEEIIKIYEEDDLDWYSVTILTSGYYLFGCNGTQIDEQFFKGDFDYFFQEEGSYSLEYQMIEENLNIPYDVDLSIVGTPFLNDWGSVSVYRNGIRIIHVKSYAVFFTEGEVVSITCYGMLEQTPNTNTSISGNMTHFVDYDHPLSIEEIQSRYHATDNVDGEITNQLVFETNYNPSHIDIGSFYIILHVKDSAGHTTYTADKIIVKDFTPSSIQLLHKEYTIEVHTMFTSADAKNFFTATDNQTPQKNIHWEYQDNYQNHFNTIGTYTITGTANDYENNRSSEILTIHVVDTTKPIISLLAGGDKIIADHILSDEEIRGLLKVTDNYYSLSNTQIQIVENTCTGDQGKEYRIKVSIKDESNNIGETILKYYLTDTESPIIMVENVLYIPLGATYTNEQIIQMLKEAGIVQSQNTDVTITSIDEIVTDKEGTYEITYVETRKDGIKKEGKVKLNIFSPVENSKENSLEKKINAWYFLLLILPALITITTIILFHKKHEKN